MVSEDWRCVCACLYSLSAVSLYPDFVGLNAVQEQPFGCMHVNAITEIKPCPRETFKGHQWYTDVNNSQTSSSVAITALECVAAFFLDSGVLDGRLCLVYRGGLYSIPSEHFCN